MEWNECHALWMTVNLLVARECRKTYRDVADELEEWLDSVATSVQSSVSEIKEKDENAWNINCGTPTSTGVPELPKEKKKKKKKPEVAKLPAFQNEVVSFSHPHVRSRLEKLMGSNIVRLTDRVYMQKLQERIYEDHLEQQRRRIKERELEEMDRQKKLILEGKIPVEEAPEELMEHPVFKVAEMARQIIQSRRKQEKGVAIISSYYYGTAEGDEAAAREADEVLGITAGRRQSQEEAEECFLTDDEGFMFTPEEYEKLKYEMPLVKQLRGLETVDEIYALADDIIGPLKTMKRGQHCGTRNKSSSKAEQPA